MFCTCAARCQEFSVTLYLRQIWKDDRLAFNSRVYYVDRQTDTHTNTHTTLNLTYVALDRSSRGAFRQTQTTLHVTLCGVA